MVPNVSRHLRNAFFCVCFFVIYPPFSFFYFSLINITVLGLVGHLFAEIVISLVIAGSDRSSLLHRCATAIMQRLQGLQNFLSIVFFALTVSMFGIPYILPLGFFYCLFTLLCLPMLAFFRLTTLCHVLFPATSRRCRTAAIRPYRFLVAKIKSLHRGYEELTELLPALFLSSRFWPAINNTTMDNLVFFLRRARARLRPALAVEDVVTVISTAVLYYVASASGSGLILVFAQVVLTSPIFVAQRIAESWAAAKSDYKEVEREEWQEAYQFNSHVYRTLPFTGNSATVGTVRLLTIRPGPRQEPLSCMLQVAQLSDAQHSPVYEAISYVWGSDTPSTTIMVNGLSFRVSESLRRMLLRLRNVTQPRVVWVDAICINQGDLNERASQVRLMAQVFSLAKQVVVCFGERSPLGFGQAVGSSREPPDASSIHYVDVRAAEVLLSNPWWTRTWVIQEIVLARRVVVFCGACEVSWDELCHLLRRASCHSLFRSDRRVVHLEDFLAIDRHYRQRKEFVRQNGKPGESQGHLRSEMSNSRGRNLLALMYDFRTRDATDPRDKIFALQGLSEEGELCKPNYIRPPSELMVEFSKSHIRHSRSLSALALVECARHHRPSNPEETVENSEATVQLPSWCPAFTDQYAVNRGMGLRPLWTGLPDDNGFGPYSAAGNLAIPDAFDPNVHGSEQALSILVLRHVCLTIASVGPAYKASVDNLKRELLEVMYHRSSSMRSSLLGLLDKESVFDNWLALIARLHHLPMIPGKNSDFTNDDGSMQVRDDLLDTLTAGGPVHPLDELPNTSDKALRNIVCTRRKLFTTHCGSFGLGPEDVKEGDQVYIALGCQTPIVLRPKAGSETRESTSVADEYSYIGQAYIKQLMLYRGDLASDLHTGKVETECKIVV